ncbi:MAG: hypothetical protein J5820_02610, partial [Rhodocyclaceae bacterium]|nr:hypothetical protein [Rhodocyclaceae bacterium]
MAAGGVWRVLGTVFGFVRKSTQAEQYRKRQIGGKKCRFLEHEKCARARKMAASGKVSTRFRN